MNQPISITGFLWGKWAEEDNDDLNLLIITPERDAQKRRMLACLDEMEPAKRDAGGNDYYSLAVLDEAWTHCVRPQ